jgi:hypothetical protein
VSSWIHGMFLSFTLGHSTEKSSRGKDTGQDRDRHRTEAQAVCDLRLDNRYEGRLRTQTSLPRSTVSRTWEDHGVTSSAESHTAESETVRGAFYDCDRQASSDHRRGSAGSGAKALIGPARLPSPRGRAALSRASWRPAFSA